MKGVILAGGSGTRLHPLTRITNKHLLPIYDRPMVDVRDRGAGLGGVTELMLVTGGTHAGEFFRLLGNGHEYGIDRLLYAYQEKAGGIAEALGLAERFVDRDRVVVMLADNVFERSLRPSLENFEAQEAARAIVLARVEDDPSTCATSACPRWTATRVARIVEKPDDAAERVRGHRRLLLRRDGLGRAADAGAVRPRRARDHRREQLVRRAGDDGVRRRSRASGATPASRSTPTTRSTTSSARTGRTTT